MTKIWNIASHCGDEEERQELSHTAGGKANGTTILEDSLAVTYKTKPILSI